VAHLAQALPWIGLLAFAACAPGDRASAPPRAALQGDVLPPLDAASDRRARGLVAALADVSEEGMGYSAAYTGTEFLPYPESSDAGMLLLQRPPLVRSPALRAIVEMGAPAVPALLDCLSDARPTRVPPVRALMWTSFDDEYDFNRRTQRDPEPMSPSRGRAAPSWDYVVKVGDLCFVALGQILNRSFSAVRYQPSGGLVVSSPPLSPALRLKTADGLRGFDAERHRDDLLRDFRLPDFAGRREGAALRALEEAAVELLQRDTYDPWAIRRFAREQLYAEPDPERRRALFEGYVAEHGPGARGGLLVVLFEDLDTLEAQEEHRITPPLTEFNTQPRELFVSLFGFPPTVRAEARPYVDDVSITDLAKTIDALRHAASPRIDRAVLRAVLATRDRDVTIAATRRLGDAAQLESFLRRRRGRRMRGRRSERGAWADDRRAGCARQAAALRCAGDLRRARARPFGAGLPFAPGGPPGAHRGARGRAS
jgi:hypothetical protein